MTHCLPKPRPLLTVKPCKLNGGFIAEVKGITQQPGWAAAHRDCPIDAMHSAICNALVWLDIDRAKAVTS